MAPSRPSGRAVRALTARLTSVEHELGSGGRVPGGRVPGTQEVARPVGAPGPRRSAGERLLPVLPPLAVLLPAGGLRQGTTVTVSGSASLLLALMAGPSRTGSWCAVVGLTSLGVVAAAEAGVVLDRLALVAVPGPDWPAVVAALLDAFDVVAVTPPSRMRGSDTRRLTARARERGAVLVPSGPWEGADVRLAVVDGCWAGLGEGFGHLRARWVEVRAEGRGAAARPRRTRLWLPATGGGSAPEGRPVATLARNPSPRCGPSPAVPLGAGPLGTGVA